MRRQGFRRGERKRARPEGDDDDDQLLAVLTVVVLAADEVERSGPVELEDSVAVVPFLDRAVGVALVVPGLVHQQHRVPSFLVLEMQSVVDQEPVPTSPLAVILRGMNHPAISATDVELASLDSIQRRQ